MRILSLFFALVLSANAQTLPGWTLVWSDEFDYTGGPDSTKWFNFVKTGSNECNTNGTNVSVNGQYLVDEARNDGPAVGCARRYTTGRIQTATLDANDNLVVKFQVRYGRVEARIKCPPGQGMAPAFWLRNYTVDGGPGVSVAEIDIFEDLGNPHNVIGTVHYRDRNGSPAFLSRTMSTPIDLTEDFHVYAIEWSRNDVKFFFDGVQYGETTPNDLPSGSTWLGNNPYFVIISTGIVANASGPFPSDMLVDYARVYKKRVPYRHRPQPH